MQAHPADANTQAAGLGAADDASIVEALAMLRADTRNLQRQTRVLETQITTTHHKDRGQPTTSNRLPGEINLSSQAQLANNVTATELKSKVQERQTKAEKETRVLGFAISEQMKADNRVLASLSEQSKVPNSTDHLASIDERIDQLAGILHSKRTAALKDRLDAVYWETLAAYDTTAVQPLSNDTTIAQLKDDIKLLYTEIEDMVTMLIGQEHSIELQSVINAIRAQENQEAIGVLQKAQEYLDVMLHRTTHLNSQLQAVQAQQRTLSEIENHIDECHPETLLARRETTAPPGTFFQQARQNQHDARQVASRIESLQTLLKSVVKQRQEAVRLVPVILYDSEKAELDALDRRIAMAKQNLESLIAVRS